MVLKYVLLVLVALIALSFLAETVIYMMFIIYMSVRSSMYDKSVSFLLFFYLLVGIFRIFVSLPFLSLYVLGWYPIFKEHFLFSVTFSFGLVLYFITTVFCWDSSAAFFQLAFNSFSELFITPQPLIFAQIVMFLRVAGVTVLPVMMVPYTIMIRKKTPVEGSIMLDDVQPPESRQNQEDDQPNKHQRALLSFHVTFHAKGCDEEVLSAKE